MGTCFLDSITEALGITVAGRVMTVGTADGSLILSVGVILPFLSVEVVLPANAALLV